MKSLPKGSKPAAIAECFSRTMSRTAGTWLSAQVADAVRVPVIAAGGSRRAAELPPPSCLALRACRWERPIFFVPSECVPLHRQALKTARMIKPFSRTSSSGRAARAIVNRIVRELGPMNEHAPAFPLAAPLSRRSAPVRAVRIRRLHALVSGFRPRVAVENFQQEN